jgi:glycosyltransferase involved in cell wall biosynthesis
MRILHTESSINWGGKELRALEEIRWLNAHGYEAWIAARPNAKILEWARAWNVPYFEVPFRGAVLPAAMSRLWSLMRQYRFDLVHCHDAHDAMHGAVLRLLGAKVIRTLHSEGISRRKVQQLIWRRGSDRVIVVSEVLKRRLAAMGVSSAKIEVINEGIDLAEFDFRRTGDKIRNEFNIPPGCKVIANIGMIRTNKGQRYLVEAADAIVAAIPDVRFLLVGEATRPEFDEELKNSLAVCSQRDKFILTGYRTDVADFIAASDCVVISSTAEAHSRVVPQAFAMKRPVVATDVGGLPELVKPGVTGTLVPAADPAALAVGVIQTLQADNSSILANAYSMALERFQIDGMMQRTLACYERALGTHR